MRIILSFLLTITFGITTAFAEPTVEQLQKPLSKVLQKQVTIDSINPSPIPGLYQVVVGSDIFYATENGKYVIYGHLIDTSSAQPVSLTEQSAQGLRKNILSNVDENTMIIFEPAGKTKATLTTFTDIDCGYCRKMHKNIKELTDAGIRVRYIAFPRTGINSESYVKAVNVWCAKNPQQAFTDAMNGKVIAATPGCKKSKIIDEDLQLVAKLNVDGTPISFLEDGEIVSGYYPPTALIQTVLGEKK